MHMHIYSIHYIRFVSPTYKMQEFPDREMFRVLLHVCHIIQKASG